MDAEVTKTDEEKDLENELSLHALPDEVFIQIFSFLPIRTLLTIVMRVCKRWKVLASDSFLFLWAYQMNWPANYDLANQKRNNAKFDWQQEYKYKFLLEKAWEKGNPQREFTLVGHLSSVLCLDVFDNILVSGGKDKAVKVWDLDKRSCLCSYSLAHAGPVECLQMLKGDTFLTGGQDSKIKMWTLKEDGDEINTFLFTGNVNCLQYYATKHHIIAGLDNDMIAVHDIETNTLVSTLQAHLNWVYCLKVSGDTAVSGSFDRTVRIWDLRIGQVVGVLDGSEDRVYCVAIGENRVFSGGQDKALRIWDLRTLSQLERKIEHTWGINWMHFRKQDRRLATAGGQTDQKVNLWRLDENVTSASVVRKSSGHSSGLNTVWFDEHRLITGSTDQTIRVWDYDQPYL